MEVMIKDGMIVLPSEVWERLRFPREGRCRIEITDEEIRILRPYPARDRMIKRLGRSTLRLPIDEMIKNEEVEVD